MTAIYLIADRFSHALAVATGYPLLFKGDDFGLTNIPSALPAQTTAGRQ
jgi:uncharacterized protein with PIN domain